MSIGVALIETAIAQRTNAEVVDNETVLNDEFNVGDRLLLYT
jgi:hypothetical protein